MNPKPIIAIADDELVARELLAGALEDRYEVRIFDRAQALLDFTAGNPADMVLLDVEMPGMSGYDACRALRAGSALPDVPVIFLSARARLDDRLLGYAAGGHDYLVKPYDLDELNAKILLAIDAHRRARQLTVEVADMSEAVSVTSEMMGELGVVLDFQREMAGCETADRMADALVQALGRFGLDGCMRLRGRRAVITRSSAGSATALEASLLNHLASRPDARIVTMGPNLGFSFGDVTLLVRSLNWAMAPEAPETIESMGRARDSVALLVEGALSRLKAIDAELDSRHLVVAQDLIAMTRKTLEDLEKSAREVSCELDAVFEAGRQEFEFEFPRLGLTTEQEESLAGIVVRQRERGLAVLARGRAAEQGLRQLVDRMVQEP